MARRSQRLRLSSPIDVRLALIAVLFIGAWLIIGYRLFQVQVVQAAEFEAEGIAQRVDVETLAATRGKIFDRQGRELAISITSTSVYARPAQVVDPLSTASVLGAMLDVDIENLVQRLQSDSEFVFVARQLELNEAEEVKALDLPGIHFLEEPKRVYPSGSVAAHVVGFVDIDSTGIEGLEAEYNELLVGVEGKLTTERDPGGNVIPYGDYEIIPAVQGVDLITTIDLEVQFAAETACENALVETLAERCTIVVLDPDTFQILALVVAPTFDPEDRSDVDPSTGVLSNAAVRSVYEPGSTQKLVTVAAALEEGAVDFDTEYLVPDHIEVVEGACENDDDDIEGCFEDATPHPDEVMTVQDCVRLSSNVCTIKIEADLGDDKLEEYLNAFGYGRATGVDFPGEASGNVNLPYGCPTCPASAAIGYSLSVTPLQMAAVYATIANDGEWIQPRLVTTIIDGDGNREEIEAASHRVVSPETARIMRIMLRGVVEDGTGTLAAVDGYTVGGKTGTTRKFDFSQGAYTEEVVVSFIGMAPIEDPQLVIAVVIDSPQDGNSGGAAAAPVFAEVMRKALHQLGVSPDAN